MLYTREEHSIQLKSNFEEILFCINEIEEHARKFFEEPTLKIGFKVYNGHNTVDLYDFLSGHEYSLGEFKVYFVRDLEFDSIYTKVDHNIQNDPIFLGGFSLSQMDGCCGIAIMFHSFITIDYRNKKFGHYMTKLQKLFAKEKGYTVMICTDVISNAPQKNILEKFGFKVNFTFKNGKTKNLVELRSVNLNDTRYYDVIWKKTNWIFQKYKNILKSVKKIYSKDIIN